MSTSVQNQAQAQEKWIQPRDVNYNATKSLWNKETSDNCMLAVVQKVIYLVGAVFTAVLETIQNAFLVVANGGIWAANGIHSYFADRQVEDVKPQATQSVETTTLLVQQTTIQPVVQQEQPKDVKPQVLTTVQTTTQKAKTFGNNWIVSPLNTWVAQPANKLWQSVRHPMNTYQSVKSWYNTPATPVKSATQTAIASVQLSVRA